ncbi:hypothetical protein AK821_27535 [Pseudomonas sp. RIT-PI-r]|nr:hypothetical protein AK821_27535 [Pseudomonas sp. RIT-PI-r]
MRDALTEVEQHRAHALKVCHLATDHDCQAARLGTDYTAGHRGVQPAHPRFLRQRGRHLPSSSRLKAGKIHQQLAALCPGSNAIGAKHHFAHDRRIGQTQHHHVGVCAQFSGRRHLPGTGLDQWRALGRVAIPHGQRVTRGQQTPTHGQPHQTDSGEPQRR